jgi:hypothetical protein
MITKYEIQINAVLETANNKPNIDIGLLKIAVSQLGNTANVELKSVRENGCLIFLSAPEGNQNNTPNNQNNQIEPTNER